MIEQVGADTRKAVELDPADAEARVAWANHLVEKGQLAEAEAQVDRALELSPANIHVLVLAASLFPYAGRVEEAVEAADRAMRLDPQMGPANRTAIKDACFFARNFEKAIDVLTSIPEESRSRASRLYLTASFAFLGRGEAARAAEALFVARHGEPSAELWLNQGFVFARRQEQDLFVGAFRALGLPVCAEPEELKGGPAPKRLPVCVVS